jgi:tetratricopeptide (TPR) repeat protein
LSINKRKILASAQKHMQKGALDKALKDYQTLLEADPKDVNLRLKVGDLYLRLNKNDEAVTAYLKVADRFMKDGFDAKAVALYKQITRIDQKRMDVYLPLAELYQRLGLTSDAMSALQIAADAHYKDGNKPAALELMRKMATLDPSNTTSRLKVAELLRQEGMRDEALAEFEAVAIELEHQGEVEGRASVLQKVVELDPQRLGAVEALGRCFVAFRKWSQAEELAHRLIDAGSETNVEGYEILAGACEGLRRDDELPEIYKAMAQALRERGQDDRAREIAQRFTSGAMSGEVSEAAVIEAADLDAAVGGMGMGFGHDSMEDSGFLSDPGVPLGDSFAGRERDLDGRQRATASSTSSTPFSPPPLPPLSRSEATDESDSEFLDESEAEVVPAAPAADADQLLAEASVYLRYGKHERAIESLRGLLAREPEHRRAFEKLGEALAAAEQREPAIEAFQRAAALAGAEGDVAAVQAIRAQLAELDPAAAESLGRDAPAEDDEDLEIEIDELDAQELGGAPDDSEGDFSFDFGDSSQGESVEEVEAELSFSGSEVSLDATPAPAAARAPAPAERAADESDADESAADEGDADESDAGLAPEPGAGDDELEFEIDLGGDEDAAAFATADEPAEAEARLASDEPAHEAAADDADASASAASASGGSSTTPQEVLEGLEEAEVFLTQGMLDEAHAVCRRLLETAPSHPKVLLRLGEVEAARAAAERAAKSRPAAPPPVVDDDSTGEVAVQVPSPAPAAAQPAAPKAEPAPVPAPAPVAAAPPAAAPQPVAAAAPVAAPAAPSEADSGDFDLAAELSDAFDERAPGAAAAASGNTEEEGFLQVFAAFKAGVEKQLGAQDYEARFDLGIAYKEMGLLEDALGEFRVALGSPGHKLQSLHMMALCALDLGRAADSAAHLEQALALPELPADQQMALRFDLGRAFEALGDRARARSAYEAVAAVDPDFCDVGERIEGLDAEPGSAPAPAAGEGFESFDDLMSEALADEAEASDSDESEEGERYESFEDIVGEGDEQAAGDEPDEPEDETQVAEITAAEAAEDEEPEPPPAPPPPAPEPRTPKRRKKISFV